MCAMFVRPSMLDSDTSAKTHLHATLALIQKEPTSAKLKPCPTPGVVDVVHDVYELNDTTIFAVGPKMTRQTMNRLLQTTSYSEFQNPSDAKVRVQAIDHETLYTTLLLHAERELVKNGLDMLKLIASYLGNSEQRHFILCAPNTALQTRLGRHETRRMAATFRHLLAYFIGDKQALNRNGHGDSALAPDQDPPRSRYRHENADYMLSLFAWQKISLTTLLDFQHQRTAPAGMAWRRPLIGLVDDVRFNDHGDIDCAAHGSRPARKVEWHHKSALLVAPTGAGKSAVIFGYLFQTIQNAKADQSREGYVKHDREGRLLVHTGALIVPSQIVYQFQVLFATHWPECKLVTVLDQKTAKAIPSFHHRSECPDLVILSTNYLKPGRAALVPIQANLPTEWTLHEWEGLHFSCVVIDEAHELGECLPVPNDPRTLYLDPKVALLRYALHSAFTVSFTATPQLGTVESVARYLCMNQLVEYTTVAPYGEQSRLVFTEPFTQQEATHYGSRAFPTNHFKETQAALKVSVSGTSFRDTVNHFLDNRVLFVADAALRPLSRLTISHYSSRVEHAAVQNNRFQKYLEKHIRDHEIVSHQDIWTTFMATEEVDYAQKKAINDAKRAALLFEMDDGYDYPRRRLEQEAHYMERAINNLRAAYALDKAQGNPYLFDGPIDHPLVQKLNTNVRQQQFKKKNGLTHSEYMLGSLLHFLVAEEGKKVLLYMEPLENRTLDLSFLATILKALQVPVVVYRGTCKALQNKINRIQAGPSVAILSGNNVSGVNMPFMDIMVIYGKLRNEAALKQARGRVNRACCHVNRPDGSCCAVQKCTELWVDNTRPAAANRGTKRAHAEP
jgi:hypothetical protein